MQATSDLLAKVSVGEPWDFCTPEGRGVFDVKIEKIESAFILAKVVAPFKWNGNLVRYVIGTCRHLGAKTSDVKCQEGVHLNIAALDHDIETIQQLGLKKAWDKSNLFLIGKMTMNSEKRG